MKEGELNLEKQIAAKGKEAGEAWLRQIFKGFEHFYIIDTGVYDVAAVAKEMQPLIDVLEGTVEVVPGRCGLLRKLLTGAIDENFRVIAKEG